MTGKFDFLKNCLCRNARDIQSELERPGRRLIGNFSHRMAYIAGVEDVVKMLNDCWESVQAEKSKQ
ncbi:hypothetical protein MASR1M12_00200 [Erysipelotrichia bacterium]